MVNADGSILVDELTKLDPTALSSNDQQSLLSYFYDYLIEVKRGFDKWSRDNTRYEHPEVEIRFLTNQNNEGLRYSLYFSPKAKDDPIKNALYLIDMAHVTDELHEWFEHNLSGDNQKLFEQYDSDLSFKEKLIVGNYAFKDEPLVNSLDWRQRFISKVEQQITFLQALQTQNSANFESPLSDVLRTINTASEAEVLAYWRNPLPEGFSVSQWLENFYDLEIGRNILEGKVAITVAELRTFCNQYTKLIAGIIRNPNYQTALEAADQNAVTVSNKIASKSAYFDAVEVPIEKTPTDQNILTLLISDLNALIPALMADEATIGEKLANGENPNVPAKRSNFKDQGGDGIDTPDSQSAQVGAIPQGPPPSYDNTPTVDWANYSNQVFSIQTGFITNQIIGDLCGMYGIPFTDLPPEMVAEVQNVVRMKLFGRIQGQQLGSGSRYELGQQIFREILQNDVGLLTKFRKTVIAAAQEKKLQLANEDPLQLQQSRDAQNRLALYEAAKHTIPSDINSPESLEVHQAFLEQSSSGAYSKTIPQSDREFFTALTELNITDTSQQLVIKNLVFAYLYSFGIGPEELLQVVDEQQLEALFGVNLDPAQVEKFKQVLTSYWQYQKTYVENLTGHQFSPNPNLLQSLNYRTITQDEINEMGQIGRDSALTFLEDFRDSRDVRIRLISSNSSGAQLKDPEYQEKLLTEFKSFNPDLSPEQQEAVAGLSLTEVTQLRERQRVFFMQQMQQEVTAQQIQNLIRLAQDEELNDLQQQALDQYLIVQRLSQQQRQNAVNDLTEALAIQQLLSLLDEADDSGSGPSLLSRLSPGRSQSTGNKPSLLNTFKRARGLNQSAKTALNLRQLWKANPQAALGAVAGQLASSVFGQRVGKTVGDFISNAGIVTFLVNAGGALFSAIGGLLPALGVLGGLGLGAAAIDVLSRSINGAGQLTGVGNIFGAKSAMASNASAPASATAAAPVAATPAAAGGGLSGILAGTNIGAASITGGLAVCTAAVVITLASTTSSLIKPLPTITDNNVSPYVTITKSTNLSVTKIQPSQLPITVTYSITIRADKDYALEINSMSDVMKALYNTEAQPQRAGAPSVDIRSRSANQLMGAPVNFPIILQPGQSLTIPDYQETFGPEYTDSNITNVFEIGFTATKLETGEVAPGKTAKTAVVLCLGECPQKAGCWPASGYVYQLPNGSYSHPNSDAFDISNTPGTPVYAPFPGRTFGGVDSPTAYRGGFGTYVTLTTQIDGVPRRLMFAHLSEVMTNVMNMDVPEGTLIGLMGNSGRSDGSHLHYELDRIVGGSSRWSAAPAPSELKTMVSGTPDGMTVTRGQYVTSCYDP